MQKDEQNFLISKYFGLYYIYILNGVFLSNLAQALQI